MEGGRETEENRGRNRDGRQRGSDRGEETTGKRQRGRDKGEETEGKR